MKKIWTEGQNLYVKKAQCTLKNQYFILLRIEVTDTKISSKIRLKTYKFMVMSLIG